MDRYNNNNYSPLDNSSNIPNVFGYSIERGNTTYKNTLEERIQAAKSASNLKHAQKPKNPVKLFLTNNKNITVEKNINHQKITEDLKMKHKQRSKPSSFSTDINLSSDISSSKSTVNYCKNQNSQIKLNNALRPTFQGGGKMQSRLEAIKSKKCNKFLAEQDNILEVTKFVANPSKNINLQKSQKEVPASNLCDIRVPSPNSLSAGVFKSNTYQTRSTVRKNDIQYSTYNEHCDRTKDTTKILSKPIKFILLLCYAL